MARRLKMILAVSLALNIILIVGFVLFKQSVNAEIYKLDALNAQSNATLVRYILQELDSNDSERLKNITLYLRSSLTYNATESEEYRKAFKN